MIRKNKYPLTITLSLLSSVSMIAHAETAKTHVVVAPQCLIKQSHIKVNPLSVTTNFALLKTDEKGIDQLIAAKTHTGNVCGGFMDVTQSWHDYTAHHTVTPNNAAAFLKKYTMPVQPLHPSTYDIKYQKEVNALIGKINPQDMWTDLTTLTQFPDRYSRSDNGVQAAEWIKTQVETMAKNTGHDDVTVYTVATGSQYKQPSVVAKIGNSSEPGIVIGGHMDTLSSNFFSLKPGADDDGSGSVTVLETARTLLASGMHFKKPIYLVWYSAEEMGLIGSQFVVKDFKRQNIPVSAVIQFDMTGYAYKNDPTIWLIDDYVDKNLTAYLETLVKTYVKQPVKYTTCGYACSDHATWHQEGFVSSMPFEASFGNDNPDIHSSSDTMDKLSLTHMTDYAKLATAFAVELAEPMA